MKVSLPPNLRSITAIICLNLASASASSGELVLHNQDSLKGELFAVNPDHIVWSTESIGQINVPKGQIFQLFTSVPIRMKGVEEVCYWLGLENLDAIIQCGKNESTWVNFHNLRDVILMDGYVQHGRSYNGKLVGVGSRSEGNKNREDWLVDLDVHVRHYDYRHLVGLKYEAESIEEGDLKKELEATYSLNWFFSSRTFLFSDVSGQKDETRDLNARYTFGSGLGYQFWDTGKTALSAESGIEYVHEETGLVEKVEDEFFSWRLASEYRYRFPREIQFYIKADYLQSINEQENWEVDAEAGVALPIAMGITADARYEYDYDNTPPEGLVKEDSNLRFGFGYHW